MAGTCAIAQIVVKLTGAQAPHLFSGESQQVQLRCATVAGTCEIAQLVVRLTAAQAPTYLADTDAPRWQEHLQVHSLL